MNRTLWYARVQNTRRQDVPFTPSYSSPRHFWPVCLAPSAWHADRHGVESALPTYSAPIKKQQRHLAERGESSWFFPCRLHNGRSGCFCRGEIGSAVSASVHVYSIYAFHFLCSLAGRCISSWCVYIYIYVFFLWIIPFSSLRSDR